MADFKYLNKVNFDEYSEELFTILNDNMSLIIHSNNNFEEDYKRWYTAVDKGLQKDNRQIVLIFETDTKRIIGFFQYYVKDEVFMMEEIQIIREFQGKDNIFRDLYGFLISNINPHIQYVQAFVNKNNNKSVSILKKLGLEFLQEDENYFKFQGNYSDLLNWYTKK